MRKGKKGPVIRYPLRIFLLFFPILLVLSVLFVLLNNSDWNGSDRITVVIQNVSPSAGKNSVIIYSVEPGDDRAIALSVPSNTMLEVPYGYDKYLASSVYRLGELDPNRKSGNLLKKSVENTFRIAVDHYVVFKDETHSLIPLKEDDLKTVKKQYFSIPGFFRFTALLLKNSKFIESDIKIYDALKLWKASRRIRIDKILYLDLSDNGILVEKGRPDNELVQELDYDRFDYFIKDYFENSSVRAERLSVEIVNASGQNKLAAYFSSILTHMGATVISKATSSDAFPDRCSVYITGDVPSDSKLVSILSDKFGCRPFHSRSDQQMADLQIILGSSFVQ